MKMTETTYYERNRDFILNRAKDYYKDYKERLRDHGRDKYRSLSEKEKSKRENMEEIDIIICLKETKTRRMSKKYCKANKSRNS